MCLCACLFLFWSGNIQLDVGRFTLLLGEFAGGSAHLIHHSWVRSVGLLGSGLCGAWVCRSCYGRNIVSYPLNMCIYLYIYIYLHPPVYLPLFLCTEVCCVYLNLKIYLQRSVSAGFTLGFLDLEVKYVKNQWQGNEELKSVILTMLIGLFGFSRCPCAVWSLGEELEQSRNLLVQLKAGQWDGLTW